MAPKSIIGAFVVGLALFSFWPFVVGKYQQVSALREALIAREALVEERQEALDNLTKEFEKFDVNLSGNEGEKFSAMVPAQRDAAELISAIDAIAKKTGIAISEINISERGGRRKRGGKAGAEALKTVEVSLEIESSYSSFRKFLEQLESNIRLLDVKALDIAQDSKNPKVQKYDLEMTAYFISP